MYRWLLVLFIILLCVKTQAQVIGKETYDNCCDDCYYKWNEWERKNKHIINKWCRDTKNDNKYWKERNKSISLCKDRCWNELNENAPDVANHIKKVKENEALPGESCFINNL